MKWWWTGWWNTSQNIVVEKVEKDVRHAVWLEISVMMKGNMDTKEMWLLSWKSKVNSWTIWQKRGLQKQGKLGTDHRKYKKGGCSNEKRGSVCW